MERLFVDTGAWYAYANRKDRDHARVAATLRPWKGRVVTSGFVFDEVVTLCLARGLGHAMATRIGGLLRTPSVVDLVHVTPEDERAAWALFRERPDQGYSFTDCTSFVLMRRLGIERAAALDEHFAVEKFDVVP